MSQTPLSTVTWISLDHRKILADDVKWGTYIVDHRSLMEGSWPQCVGLYLAMGRWEVRQGAV